MNDSKCQACPPSEYPEVTIHFQLPKEKFSTSTYQCQYGIGGILLYCPMSIHNVHVGRVRNSISAQAYLFKHWIIAENVNDYMTGL